MSNAVNEDLVSRAQTAPDEDGCGLSRRSVLIGATVAAGAVAGVSPALANAPAQAGFGAPLVELCVPLTAVEATSVTCTHSA